MSYVVARRGFGQGDSTVCAPQDWNPATNTCQPGWNKQAPAQPAQPAAPSSGSDLLTQFENWVQGMTSPSAPTPGTSPTPMAPASPSAPAPATDNTSTYLLVGGIAVVGIVALVLLTK